MNVLKMIERDQKRREKIAEQLFSHEVGERKEVLEKEFWENQFLYVEARELFIGKKVILDGYDEMSECCFRNRTGVIFDVNYADDVHREKLYFSVLVEELDDNVTVYDAIMELVG